MIDRRDLLVAGACLATMGVAEWMRPRKNLQLINVTKLGGLVPEQFGRWSLVQGGGVVVPVTEGSLADRLYADTLIRLYGDRDDEPPVMLLIAYGKSQSDALQLHRPESCYPAIGFSISNRSLTEIPMSKKVTVPGVHLTASAQERVEDICYWARLGEHLPQTASQQRRDRLETAMHGFVADGVLVRASTIRTGDKPNFAKLDEFLKDLIAAIAPSQRAGFIGSTRASALR